MLPALESPITSTAPNESENALLRGRLSIRAAEGSKGAKLRETPVIGIDPGHVTGVAILQGGNEIHTAHLKAMSVQGVLDAFLPAHVFIEQPVGSNEPTQKLWEHVNGIVSLLRPFDRKRQLIPPNVWRAEVLPEGGNATKKDALRWVRTNYPSLKGQYLSSDVAEAICVMEYGRRLVTGSLRRGKPPLPVSHVPECDLSPAERRGKGTGKRGRPSNAFRLGRTLPDDPEEPSTDLYEHAPGVRWRILAEEGGPWLHTIMRVYVTGYVFVGGYAAYRPKRVTWRAWATDAHVSQSDLKPAIAALYDAGLVQHDVAISQPRRRRNTSAPVAFRPDAPLLFVPVEDELTRPFHDLFRAHVKPRGKDGKRSNYATLVDRWDGEKGEPSIPPSDWSGKLARERRDRLFSLTCGMCGSRNVPPWANPDAPLCVTHCDDTRDAPLEKGNPPHGDDDHENDGNCRKCAEDEAAFLAECDAEEAAAEEAEPVGVS